MQMEKGHEKNRISNAETKMRRNQQSLQYNVQIAPTIHGDANGRNLLLGEVAAKSRLFSVQGKEQNRSFQDEHQVRSSYPCIEKEEDAAAKGTRGWNKNGNTQDS